MKTLNGNILVKELQNNGSVTPEGVILPDSLELPYEIGAVIVVHAGTERADGSVREPMVRPGNLIAYRANAGTRIMIPGGEDGGMLSCRFVAEGFIIAILEDDVTNRDAGASNVVPIRH